MMYLFVLIVRFDRSPSPVLSSSSSSSAPISPPVLPSLALVSKSKRATSTPLTPPPTPKPAEALIPSPTPTPVASPSLPAAESEQAVAETTSFKPPSNAVKLELWSDVQSAVDATSTTAAATTATNDDDSDSTDADYDSDASSYDSDSSAVVDLEASLSWRLVVNGFCFVSLCY